uniref:Uncharacterized protein n=1 Tax=Panagrellus redivivus TaxID=6233 RepID=A0A7E4W2K7_PANRE
MCAHPTCHYQVHRRQQNACGAWPAIATCNVFKGVPTLPRPSHPPLNAVQVPEASALANAIDEDEAHKPPGNESDARWSGLRETGKASPATIRRNHDVFMKEGAPNAIFELFRKIDVFMFVYPASGSRRQFNRRVNSTAELFQCICCNECKFTTCNSTRRSTCSCIIRHRLCPELHLNIVHFIILD